MRLGKRVMLREMLVVLKFMIKVNESKVGPEHRFHTWYY